MCLVSKCWRTVVQSWLLGGAVMGMLTGTRLPGWNTGYPGPTTWAAILGHALCRSAIRHDYLDRMTHIPPLPPSSSRKFALLHRISQYRLPFHPPLPDTNHIAARILAEVEPLVHRVDYGNKEGKGKLAVNGCEATSRGRSSLDSLAF